MKPGVTGDDVHGAIVTPLVASAPWARAVTLFFRVAAMWSALGGVVGSLAVFALGSLDGARRNVPYGLLFGVVVVTGFAAVVLWRLGDGAKLVHTRLGALDARGEQLNLGPVLRAQRDFLRELTRWLGAALILFVVLVAGGLMYIAATSKY